MIFLYTLNYIYIYYNNLCKFLNINWGRKKQTAVESNFMHETGSAAEEEDEEQETRVERMPEHEEEKERRPRRKKKAKSRKKEQEYSLTNIGKQLEKQTNYLARLEEVLQPLRNLAKSSEVQSKLVKDINTSVKQMERQIVQVRKGIQKGKTKKK